MNKKIKLATLLAALFLSTSVMAADWDSKAVYTAGATVTYQGKNWKAKWWTTGEIPGGTQWGPWAIESNPVPTTSPTAIPTATPTASPTAKPTATPTAIPTATPTVKPTATPTTIPTATPTAVPTASPTATPTATPSATPTATPTASPTPGGNTCAQVWNPDEIYRPNLGVVIRSAYGKNYQANYYSSNIEPSANSAVGGAWKTLGACTGPSTPRASGPETLAEAQAHEAAAISTPYMQMIRASVATLDNKLVEQVTPGNQSNPANVKRVEGIVSQQQWNYFFPEANPGYTYTNFLRGVAKFPSFCADYSDGRNADQICRRVVAAFFAHVVQETGNHSASSPNPKWRQGLTALREGGDGKGSEAYSSGCGDVNWQKQFDGTLACGKNPDGTWISYYGRGAHQISYIFNYAPLSLAIYGDRAVLRDNPDLVASTWLNMASALYFFVTPQPPKPSVLHTLDGTWVPNATDIAGGLGNDFPTTSQIINGECMSNPIKPTAQARNNFYVEFARELNLDISKESMKCTDMKAFSGGSSAAVAIYWNKSEETADNPAPIKYQCRLTSEQSGFSALIDDQYKQCVEAKWSVKLK